MEPAKPTLRALLLQIQHLALFPLTRLYSISTAPVERWVGLQGNASSIPLHTATAKYENWEVKEPHALPESLRGPVWSGRKNYLAYGIDLIRIRERDGEVEESWVHSTFDVDEEYLDPLDRESILPDLALKITKDLQTANGILDLLDRRGGLRAARVDRAYSGECLRPLENAAQPLRELRRARHVMDERLAAINFGILHADPDVRAYVEQAYAPYISKWHLLDCMRGLYLDMRASDIDTVHILDLLQKKVPVFYPYDDNFLPPLTSSEVRASEAIRDPKEFAYWLTSLSRWPVLDKTLPTPSKGFGWTKSEREASPYAVSTRWERFDRLIHYATSVLADTYLPSTSPAVPVVKISHMRIVASSRLIVGPLTELKMMLWAIQNRPSNSAEVLGEALLRGWSFQTAFPRDHLQDVLGSQSDTPTPERVLPIPLMRDAEPLNILIEWLRYLEKVIALLSRPNSRAFLCQGGILWRLSILIGERYLSSWLEDPIGLPVGVGYSGTQPFPEYWTNDVTQREKDILIGATMSRFSGTIRSWFPPPDLFDNLYNRGGEWSIISERFVMERYESLQRRETRFKPLTLEEWEVELGSVAQERLLRSSFVPVEALHVNMLLMDVRAELDGSWNGISLGELDHAMGRMNEDSVQ